MLLPCWRHAPSRSCSTTTNCTRQALPCTIACMQNASPEGPVPWMFAGIMYRTLRWLDTRQSNPFYSGACACIEVFEQAQFNDMLCSSLTGELSFIQALGLVTANKMTCVSQECQRVRHSSRTGCCKCWAMGNGHLQPCSMLSDVPSQMLDLDRELLHAECTH
jgi:hypothetical protein